MKCYLQINNLVTDFQHAHKEGHSNAAALTQLTDGWLVKFENKRMVSAVLLDLSAAFDIIDYELLLKKKTKTRMS